MTYLNELLSNPVSQCLNAILLTSLWQSAAILLTLGALFYLLKPAYASTRYVLAYAALILCLASPVFTQLVAFSRSNMAEVTREAKAPMRDRLVVVAPRSSMTDMRSIEETVAAHNSQATRLNTYSWPMNWKDAVGASLRWAVLVWFTGIITLSLRLALGIRLAHELQSRFVTSASQDVTDAVRRISTEMKVRQKVLVRMSKVVDVPLVAGFVKPTILIPVNMLIGMTPQQLDMIVAHELAHIRRFDPIANLIQNLIDTLLFFNPAALWISELVRQERECCCDSLAVQVCGGDKMSYAKTLATLNRLRMQKQVNLAADGGSLIDRARRLTGHMPARQFGPAHGIVAVSVMVVSIVMASFASAQTEGGTLRIAYSSVQQLDPYKSASGDEINAFSQIFDPLVAFSQDDYQPIPHLAESWETTDDTTWVFTIRQGVTFQDGNDVFPEGEGREVTAEDVVYSINRFLDVSTTFTLGDIEAVTAIDRYTVQIKTAAPDPFLVTDPNRLGRVLIVPREAIEQLGEEAFARQPIGSGPFELVSFTPDQNLEFMRNEDYWLPVNLAGVEFVFIPDPTVQTIALESGDVDVIPYIFNVDSVSQLSENPDLKLIEGFGSYRGLGFNVTTPPFDEFAVRDAISKAIDIDGAIAAVVAPFGTRAYGQVAPWTGFETDPSLAELWTYNPEAALAELAEAGFTDSDGDGVLDRNGQPLSFSIKTIAGSQVRVLTILVTQLQELGIGAKLLQQDGAVWGDDLQQGNDTGVFFDYSFSGITGLYSLFHSSNNGRSNTHFYTNPEVDALLDEASQTIEFQKRNNLWLEAQRLIMKDRVAIPLYFENGYAVTSTQVQDFLPAVAGLNLVSTENNVSLSE